MMILRLTYLYFLVFFISWNLHGECFYQEIKTIHSDEMRSTKSLADQLFNSLHFDSASILYRSVMDMYSVKDAEYYRIINRLVECLWWRYQFYDAEKIARENLQDAINNLGPTHPEVGSLYLNLGILAFLASSSAMPEEYFQKALENSLGNFGFYHPVTATVYEWLGTYHESFSDQEISYQYLRQSLKCWLKIREPDDPDLGNIYRYLGLYYKRFNKNDSALICFKKAEKLFNKRYGLDNFQSVKCLVNQCDVYEEIGNFHQSSLLLDDALQRIKRAKGETLMAHVMTLYSIFDYKSKQGDLISAAHDLQQVFSLFFRDFSDTSILVNPKNINTACHYYVKLILTSKSSLLKTIYKEDPHHPIEYLLVALQCDSLVSQINRQLRNRIINYENLLTFEQIHANMHFRFATEALFVYSLTGNKKHITQALCYLEENRNMQLLKQTGNSLEVSAISSDFIKKHDSYQSDINRLQNKYLSETSIKAKKDLERQIRDKKIELDQFCFLMFESQKLKPNQTRITKKIDLQTIQDQLDEQTTILSIFEHIPDYTSITDQFLILAITKHGFRYRLYEKDILSSQLPGFSDLYSSPAPNPESVDSTGVSIYQKLFAPFHDLMQGTTKLVIIPSIGTWMIPFEALPTDTKNYGIANRYLINRFTIQKEFSLLTWLSPSRDEKKRTEILAIAPKFNNSIKNRLALLTNRDSSLIDLPGSRKECEEISKLFPGRLISGYAATKQAFLDHAQAYQIIHISTHGIPSPENKLLLMLAFNTKPEEPINHGYLSFYEILNLHLNTNLVVLSACKSALGAENKSEGNLNLAWAFQQAGAQSVIVSLWDVNDFASSYIMPAFYRYLSNGYSKPEALRQAKLEYIKQADKPFQHPFFWAGYDYIGDDTPLNIVSVSDYLKKPQIWFLFSCVAGILMLVVRRWK